MLPFLIAAYMYNEKIHIVCAGNYARLCRLYQEYESISVVSIHPPLRRMGSGVWVAIGIRFLIIFEGEML